MRSMLSAIIGLCVVCGVGCVDTENDGVFCVGDDCDAVSTSNDEPECPPQMVLVMTGIGNDASAVCKWICDASSDCPNVDACVRPECVTGTVIGVGYCQSHRVHGTVECK